VLSRPFLFPHFFPHPPIPACSTDAPHASLLKLHATRSCGDGVLSRIVGGHEKSTRSSLAGDSRTCQYLLQPAPSGAPRGDAATCGPDNSLSLGRKAASWLSDGLKTWGNAQATGRRATLVFRSSTTPATTRRPSTTSEHGAASRLRHTSAGARSVSSSNEKGARYNGPLSLLLKPTPRSKGDDYVP
jgi:hypothetical protein